MDLFGMGGAEILLILVIALLVMGPTRIVEFAGMLGRMVRNLRRITSEMTTAVSREINMSETRGHLPPGADREEKTGEPADDEKTEPDSPEKTPPGNSQTTQ